MYITLLDVLNQFEIIKLTDFPVILVHFIWQLDTKIWTRLPEHSVL